MIIDSCYEGVITKLTAQGKIKEISDHLLSLDTNDKRVLFVYKILEDLNAFPKVQEVKKNDDLSVHYRNQGNTFFQQYKHHKAWQYYNLSLLYATLSSENYCLALSNRSAVFYELGKYDECLQDVDKVLSLEYPKNLLEKLTKRKEMCMALKKKVPKVESHELSETLEMECEKESRYLAASNKLEVLYTDEMGRHVVAKRDIKVGEILAQEDPYLSVLLKSQILCACSYCLSRSLNLLPCDSCCMALYCSNECKEKALREYHSVECPLMVTLVEMDFTKLELLALRTVIKARQDHNSWNDLFKTIEDTDANFNSEFRGHVKIDDKWIFDSKYYPSIHTLETNLEKRSVSDIFQKAVSAAVFLRFLEMNTKFLNADGEEDKEMIRSTVAGLLLLHLMTSPTNMHGISTNTESQNRTFLDEVSLAGAAYAFISLLNHSCAPNVVRFSTLGSARMTLFAIRPIKKGMQIFDNYGSHHALEDRMSRQASLKFQYKFICMCEACINNWPTYFSLAAQRCSMVPPNLTKAKNKLLPENTIESLKRGDLKTAKNIYKRLCILSETLEPYAPCMELCDCQESLKQCLAIFEGLPPYGTTQLVEWKEMLPVAGTSENMTRVLKNKFKDWYLH